LHQIGGLAIGGEKIAKPSSGIQDVIVGGDKRTIRRGLVVALAAEQVGIVLFVRTIVLVAELYLEPTGL